MSQSPALAMKIPAHQSSKNRRTRKTLQKRKKCAATMTSSHHSGLSKCSKKRADETKKPITTASVLENWNPHVRHFCFSWFMEVFRVWPEQRSRHQATHRIHAAPVQSAAALPSQADVRSRYPQFAAQKCI